MKKLHNSMRRLSFFLCLLLLVALPLQCASTKTSLRNSQAASKTGSDVADTDERDGDEDEDSEDDDSSDIGSRDDDTDDKEADAEDAQPAQQSVRKVVNAVPPVYTDAVEKARAALTKDLDDQHSIQSELDSLDNEAATKHMIDLQVKQVAQETQSPGMAKFLGDMWKDMRSFSMPFYKEHLREKLSELQMSVPGLERSYAHAKAELKAEEVHVAKAQAAAVKTGKTMSATQTGRVVQVNLKSESGSPSSNTHLVTADGQQFVDSDDEDDNKDSASN